MQSRREFLTTAGKLIVLSMAFGCERQTAPNMYEQMDQMSQMLEGQMLTFKDVKNRVVGEFKSGEPLAFLVGETHFEDQSFFDNVRNIIDGLLDEGANVNLHSESEGWTIDSYGCPIINHRLRPEERNIDCANVNPHESIEGVSVFSVNPEDIELAVSRGRAITNGDVLMVYAGVLHIGMANRNNYLRDYRGVEGRFNGTSISQYPQYAVAISESVPELSVVNLHATNIDNWLYYESRNLLYRITRQLDTNEYQNYCDRFSKLAINIERKAQIGSVYKVPDQPGNTFLHFTKSNYAPPDWQVVINCFSRLNNLGILGIGDYLLDVKGRHFVDGLHGYAYSDPTQGLSFKMLNQNKVYYHEFDREGEYIGVFLPRPEDLAHYPFM